MRAVLTNFGSSGDIVPMVVLAEELRRRGHHPVLALPPAFEALVRSRDLPFVPVGADLRHEQDEINRHSVLRPEVTTSEDDLTALYSPLARALPRTTDDLLAACAGADVLIAGRTQPSARIVHDLTHVPFASIFAEHSGSGGGPPGIRAALRAIINPERARFGLPPLDNPFVDGHSNQLVLHALSPHLRSTLLPPHHRVVGYFFLDEGPWEPLPALRDFVQDAEPPVVFSFGSMIHGDPRAFERLLLEAASRAGCRAVVQRDKSWHAHLAKETTTDLLPQTAELTSERALAVTGWLSLKWLFSRAACVVSHGGPGTGGAALRAGVPQVTVPHAHDQFTWGEILREHGVAPAPIPYRELTAEKLGRALRQVLDSAETRARAGAIGERIRAERGPERARELIEDLVAKSGMGRSDDDAEVPQATAVRRRTVLSRQRAQRQED